MARRMSGAYAAPLVRRAEGQLTWVAMGPNAGNVPMALRKMFEACAVWRGAHEREGYEGWPLLLLTLSNGVSVSGYAAAIEQEAWVLDLASGEEGKGPQDRIWVDSRHLVGLSLEDYAGWAGRLFKIEQRQPVPDSVLSLRRRTAQEFPARPVEYVWAEGGVGKEEIHAAWQMMEAVGKALEELAGEASLHGALERQVRSIRICGEQGGRFRLDGGVLEAGFVTGEMPPPAAELKGLLAMIL